jgi:outer membrane protein OmpA-like peptidoglycan-associated protein
MLSGCVTSNGQPPLNASSAPVADNPCEASRQAYAGAAVGAIAGSALGYFLGKKNATGAILGALGGGTVGFLIGRDIDQRRCAQWKIARDANVSARFDDVLLPMTNPQGQAEQVRVGQVSTWEGTGHFQSGSATLTPEAQRYFRAVAETYARPADPTGLSAQDKQRAETARQERHILLIGHTDDTGSSLENAKLSEARAKAVGEVFRAVGVNPDRLFFQGAGETYPTADNRTEEGRARNRRVEIVELESREAMAYYLRNRTPRTDLYRVATAAPSRSVVASTSPTASPSAPAGTATKPAAPAAEKQQTAKAGKPAVTAATAPAKPRSGFIDFGGVPAAQVAGVSSEMIGGTPRSSGQTLISYLGISTAHADDSVFRATCLEDRPRVGGEVRRLSDGRVFDYQTSDFLPGLYRTSYASLVNGHMVGMTDVAVLRDGSEPVGRSPLLVFRNYAGAKEKGRKPDLELPTAVNVYPGQEALLYRLFVEKPDAPLACVDLVFPYKPPFGARYGKLYYEKNGQSYAADYLPTIAR